VPTSVGIIFPYFIRSSHVYRQCTINLGDNDKTGSLNSKLGL
jgi:hypothetical protein